MAASVRAGVAVGKSASAHHVNAAPPTAQFDAGGGGAGAGRWGRRRLTI
ncbi:MAG: hypothetical protein ACREQ5_22850 [Candidatus Dormibacteria bacterium]